MRLFKTIILTLTGLFIGTYSYTQDFDAIQTAFTQSYTDEYKGEYSNAIDGLKKVYDENSYEINLRLGWLSYMSGFFTESLSFYQKAITLKPMSIEAKLGYVYPASAIGKWELVKKQYNNILALDPQNVTANYRLGSIYYGNEDYATASKYFEKVVNLFPFDHDALLMYAWTNFKVGKTREAEVLFHKVLLNTPNDASALEGLELIKK